MLKLIRFWLPLVVTVAGILLIVIGGFDDAAFELGTPIFSVGLCIWLGNILFRVGVSGDRDRDAEDEARSYFAKHGRWPGEPGSGDPSRGGR